MKTTPQKRRAPARSRTSLEKALRRAALLAMLTPLAIPFACGDSADTTSGSTTSTAGAGGGTTTTSLAGAAGTTEVDGGLDATACDPYEYTPDVFDDCGVFIRAPCGVTLTLPVTGDCYLGLNDCFPYCGEFAFNCHAVDESCVDGSVVTDSKGGVNIDCAVCVGGLGRAPEGLEDPRPARLDASNNAARPSVLGAHLARAAHLEAASVHAFRRLRGELSALGAPESLLTAARAAERDEVKHARRTGILARRRGASPARVKLRAFKPRSPEAIALENAVEGCVRETFGAAVAAFQAERAEDPEIACLMKEIAEDEARHAALSWDVADWLHPRLSPRARSRVRSSCREAIERLRREVDGRVPAALALPAGVPGPAQQKAILRALEEDLWPSLFARAAK